MSTFIKKRPKGNSPQFTCRVSEDIKRMEQELKKLECDVPALARLALKQAFEKAIESAEEDTDMYIGV